MRKVRVEENGVKKGKWTVEEDRKLIAYVNKYGFWNWRQLPKYAGLSRCGKSCRLRWMNYLRPNIKRGNYTKEEEAKIIKLHESMGNRWSAIAGHLPGRTDNDVKNHWHTTLKKKLKSSLDKKIESKPEEHHEQVVVNCNNHTPNILESFQSEVICSVPSSVLDYQQEHCSVTMDTRCTALATDVEDVATTFGRNPFRDSLDDDVTNGGEDFWWTEPFLADYTSDYWFLPSNDHCFVDSGRPNYPYHDFCGEMFCPCGNQHKLAEW